MINRSKRRSIIFKFNFSFLRMARSISISNSAICHRTLSLPPPLSPGSMKVETFERKHWLQIPLSCRRWFPSGDPNRILPLSIERPVNERFFPPALVYPQTFSPISICLIIIILESFFFFFFFFFVNERSQHRRDHRGRNFTSILRKRVRRTGFEE